MLPPSNFPIVVVGDHWVTISNQYLDCILAYIVREGSLFVTRTFTYTYGFKKMIISLDILWQQDICKLKYGKTDKQEVPFGNGVTA